jgi:hypothetical protein
MDKLHFDDLTQITCPFGMLDNDTQERLKACDDVEVFLNGIWQDDPYETRNFGYTYRAKPKPKRVVTWVQWDEDDAPLCCDDLYEANKCLKMYGGHIYRIERDEDGSNPMIELVKTGGTDE